MSGGPAPQTVPEPEWEPVEPGLMDQVSLPADREEIPPEDYSDRAGADSDLSTGVESFDPGEAAPGSSEGEV